MNTCNLCKREVDINDGGCALMMAFCRKHTTNLINISFCKDCYNAFLDRHMRAMNEDACLNISFDDGEGKADERTG